MSAGELLALDEVRTRLVAAGQAGESVGVEELREEIGVGHSDLARVLDHLREEGEASEVAPGEWRSLEDEDARHQAARAAMDRRDGREPAQDEPANAEAGHELVRHGLSTVTVAEAEGGVVLTMAVASALDAETIGKLVEAGIAEAKEAGRAFVLRVAP